MIPSLDLCAALFERVAQRLVITADAAEWTLLKKSTLDPMAVFAQYMQEW